MLIEVHIVESMIQTHSVVINTDYIIRIEKELLSNNIYITVLYMSDKTQYVIVETSEQILKMSQANG